LTKKSDEDVIREVTDCIEVAIERNRRMERAVIAVLIALFLTGLGLLIFGTLVGRWQLLAPGSVVQLIIFFPIRRLISLREDNMRLRILPQLLRLADTKEAKKLAASLIKRLIAKV